MSPLLKTLILILGIMLIAAGTNLYMYLWGTGLAVEIAFALIYLTYLAVFVFLETRREITWDEIKGAFAKIRQWTTMMRS